MMNDAIKFINEYTSALIYEHNIHSSYNIKTYYLKTFPIIKPVLE